MSSRKMTLDDLRHAQTIIRSLDDEFKRAAFAVLGFEKLSEAFWRKDDFDMAFDGDVSHATFGSWFKTIEQLEVELGEEYLE